jgi:hypothetical protein
MANYSLNEPYFIQVCRSVNQKYIYIFRASIVLDAQWCNWAFGQAC